MGAESGLRRRVEGPERGGISRAVWHRGGLPRALFRLRWSKGWVCPACGHGRYAELKGRAVYQCNRCKRQVGLTAGTCSTGPSCR